MKNEKTQIIIMSVGLILAVALLAGILVPAVPVVKRMQEDAAAAAVTETTLPEETWPEVVSDENVTNIMLVGHNYREDEPNYLSDTMILCSINRETKTMTMVSIMRDLLVPLPAYAGHTAGRNRINVCYALGSSWTGSSEGGMEMLAMCVEQNFDIPVHHTIEVDFQSFVTIIDYMGGVEVDVSEAEAKYMTENVGYVGDVQPGLQTLDGMATLAYARIRGIDNDRVRTGRQRNVIMSLIEKVRDLNVWDLYRVVNNLLPFIKTDMTTEEIANYIWEFLPMVKDLELDSLTCPVDNETLPGSYWSGMIDLYGTPASVVECDFQLNSDYLKDVLGLS